MVKSELITKSPLRIFESSTHGGVGKGNIAVIAAPKGVGKTACLVHIATDQLLQKNHVIHVTFCDTPDHIITWYEDIFKEISRRFKTDNSLEIHDEIVRNRLIMNFKQSSTLVTHVIASIKKLVEKIHFSADVIVIDGYDFSKATPKDILAFKTFAEDLDLEIWFSVSLKGKGNYFNENGIPDVLARFIDEISIVIILESHEDHVRLKLIKDHDDQAVSNMHLKLDPAILLIAEE